MACCAVLLLLLKSESEWLSEWSSGRFAFIYNSLFLYISCCVDMMLLRSSSRVFRTTTTLPLRCLSAASQAQHGKSYTYGQPFQDVRKLSHSHTHTHSLTHPLCYTQSIIYQTLTYLHGWFWLQSPRVSIITEIPNEPGSLHNILGYFWKYDIDMTSIESRPTPK